MKIAIIGCGNMGGAIARGLAGDKAFMGKNSIAVSNRSAAKLDALKAEFPAVSTSTCNRTVVDGADMVILAVKPWLVDTVAEEIKPVANVRQTIVSVAAGVDFSRLQAMFALPDGVPALFRVVPNTAIAIGESMTMVSGCGVSEQQTGEVCSLFDRLGETLLVEERLLDAAMALGSCGTAYALRYVRAAMEAGIELGLYPEQAEKIVAQTVKGAAEILLRGGAHPEAEIDKVTTPGGYTIKGLNRMEECGFSNAVIEGHKASVGK